MLKIILAIFLVFHGYIHFGVAFIFPTDDPKYLLRESWLFTALGLDKSGAVVLARLLSVLAALLYLAAVLAFFDFYLPLEHFKLLLAMASLVSLSLYLIFWQSEVIYAVAIDLLLLATLALRVWQPLITIN